MKLLRTVGFHLKNGGARAVAAGAARRLGRAFYWQHANLLLLRQFDSPVLPIDLTPLQVRFPTLDDLRSWEFEKALYYPTELSARFSRGDICLSVHRHDKLAHVAWISMDQLPIERGIPPVRRDKLAGLYDMFTLPPFRRQGCQRLAIERLCAVASTHGCKGALAAVHENNVASLTAFRQSGFTLESEHDFRRILGVSRVRIRTLKPDV